MDAAKAAWDAIRPHEKKFNEKTGKMTLKKSSTLEKGLTWQPFLAHACDTQNVAPLPSTQKEGQSRLLLMVAQPPAILRTSSSG